MKLTVRTYLDRNGRATTDRRLGVRLLGPAGMVIDDARAAALGLKQRGKPSDKMIDKPKTKMLTVPIR